MQRNNIQKNNKTLHKRKKQCTQTENLSQQQTNNTTCDNTHNRNIRTNQTKIEHDQQSINRKTNKLKNESYKKHNK